MAPFSANTPVTAGLKWAPEIGPNMPISTTSIAPVASVLPSKARATLPPASRSPMMPEPITVASSSAVPSASAATLRQVIYGLALVAIALYRPRGMVGRFGFGR